MSEHVESTNKTIKGKALANIFGLTYERVRQLHDDGVVVRTGRDKYDLEVSAQNYIRFLQERSTSTVVSEDQDYNYWRAENEKNKALLNEASLKEKNGELANKADVQMAIGHFVVSMRRVLESAPGKLKTKFPDMPNDQITAIQGFLAKVQNEISRISI